MSMEYVRGRHPTLETIGQHAPESNSDVPCAALSAQETRMPDPDNLGKTEEVPLPDVYPDVVPIDYALFNTLRYVVPGRRAIPAKSLPSRSLATVRTGCTSSPEPERPCAGGWRHILDGLYDGRSISWGRGTAPAVGKPPRSTLCPASTTTRAPSRVSN